MNRAILFTVLSAIALSSCNNNASDNHTAADSTLQDTTPAVKDSFLITTTGVGFFKLGSNKDLDALIKAYGYKDNLITEDIISNEVCANSELEGITIKRPMAWNEYSEEEEPDENDKRYICVHQPSDDAFEREMERAIAESEGKEIDNTQDSVKEDTVAENGPKFYFERNSIERIGLYNGKFKTKEGIGVGSTFKDLQNAYTGLISGIDKDPEEFDKWSVDVRVKEYPNLVFIFGEQPCKQKATGPEDGSHFDPKSKILEIWIFKP